MKALIMSAGIGSRISRYLNNQPKCCVKIDDIELIRYTFELLNKKGIKDIAIVTGYNDTYILDALKDFKFKHYRNNFYDITNSIASTWFAQDFLDDSDKILTEEQKECIIVNLIDMMLSDGEADEYEEKLLDHIIEKYDFKREKFDIYKELMIKKNDHSVFN